MRGPAVALVAAAVLSGCAGQQGGAVDEVIPTGAIQYDGSFRPIQQYSGAAGMSTQQRIFGNVRVLFRESSGRSVINLSLNTNIQQSEVLIWAIVPGRCGNGAIPLLPATQFPPLEMSSTGRGEVRSFEMPIAMPMGAYHANIYRGGETLSNVIACSNLTGRSGDE